MKTSLIKVLNFIIENSFYALFVLIPLILTPLTSELFEFNKMMLTYALTVIIVGSWLIRSVLQGRIKIKRTPLDIPLFLFLFSQIVSTLLSIDRHTSLWGYYSRFNQGLFSTLAYILLYYAFVSFAGIRMYPNHFRINPNNKPFGKIRMKIRDNSDESTSFVTNCLKWSLFSAFLVSTYGVLEHFGIDAKYWIQDVQNRVFSTVGQPNWLAAYLVALIPLTWALSFNSKLKTKNPPAEPAGLKQYLCYLLFVVSYLCLLFTKSRSGLIAFTASFIVFWSLNFWLFRVNLKIIKKSFIIITSCFIILTILVGSPWTPNLNQLYDQWSMINDQPISTGKENTKSTQPSTIDHQPSAIYYGGTESSEIRKIVWQGAIGIFKHYPFFGSGVETFAYSYYNFRPREHNDVSEWDFLYNKAHNEYLNFLATTGLVGLGSYLLIIIVYVFWSLKNLKCQSSNVKATSKKSKLSDLSCSFDLCVLRFALLSGFISIIITNFFGFSVVIIGLFFFLFPAMSISLASSSRSANTFPFPERKEAKVILVVFIFLVSSYLLLSLGQIWYADTLYAKGKKANKKASFQEAARYLERAIALRGGEPVFHDEIADTYVNLSSLAEDVQEATLSAQMKDYALKESDQALKISPRNLNFLKTRIKIYLTLATKNQEYYLDALSWLDRATALAPTDAKLVYNQAVIHFYLNQETTTINYLKKAIELRPNYRDAHATLAIIYRLNEDYDQAEEHLKYILEKIDYKDQEVKDVLETIQASRAADHN
jgi:O-antigen ligase/Flp pilus assembly protein TadD